MNKTHREIDCHIIREKLQAELFQLLLISSSQQATNIFTNPLKPTSFNHFIKVGFDEHIQMQFEWDFYVFRLHIPCSLSETFMFYVFLFYYLFNR